MGRNKTLDNRFIRWSRPGVFDRIFAALTGVGPKPERLMIEAGTGQTETRDIPFTPGRLTCRLSVVGAEDVPCRFEQEPRAPLGLVDPHFQQTRRRNVTVRVAEIVHLAHDGNELLVVIA